MVGRWVSVVRYVAVTGVRAQLQTRIPNKLNLNQILSISIWLKYSKLDYPDVPKNFVYGAYKVHFNDSDGQCMFTDNVVGEQALHSADHRGDPTA